MIFLNANAEEWRSVVATNKKSWQKWNRQVNIEYYR